MGYEPQMRNYDVTKSQGWVLLLLHSGVTPSGYKRLFQILMLFSFRCYRWCCFGGGDDNGGDGDDGDDGGDCGDDDGGDGAGAGR